MTRGDAAGSLSIFLGDSSNSNVPIFALAGKSLGDGVSVRGLDYKAQEDARVVEWSGNGNANFSVRFLQATDLNALGDISQLALQVEGRVLEAPSAPLSVAMSCGEWCSGSLELTEGLEAGDWMTYQLPLQCFVDAGLDPAVVTQPLRLETAGKAVIAIHAAEIVSGPLEKTDCP